MALLTRLKPSASSSLTNGDADAVIDTNKNSLLTTIPLGGGAGNTVYDSGSGHILVAVHEKNELVSIDPSTAKIIGRYPVPGVEHPHGVSLDVPQRLAFVAGEENHKLAVVDLTNMKVLATYPVGEDPDVLAFDPGLKLLYRLNLGTSQSLENRGRPW
jgi:DNA-binding beta-propeller fold protein YncE